jgi:hypothetical protein
MNYIKAYENLISTRKIREQITGYTEKHHIIPKSFGGTNSTENMVILTAREHFIAHLLLAKMYPESGMVHAVFKMACVNKTLGNFKVTNRLYEILRINHANRVSSDKNAAKKKSLASKGKKQSPEHIKARTESRLKNGNPWHSDETIKKAAESNTGKKHPSRKSGNDRSEAEKEASRKSAESRKGRKMLPEQVAKSVASRTGKKRNIPISEERKQQLSEEKSKKIECPHCGLFGQPMVMHRWHFDKCKQRKNHEQS